jgi:hypothetical protein
MHKAQTIVTITSELIQQPHMPKLHLNKRQMQLMDTYLFTPSIEDNRGNGESLSVTNRIISRGEVIDLKVSIIVSIQKKSP